MRLGDDGVRTLRGIPTLAKGGQAGLCVEEVGHVAWRASAEV